MNKLEKCSTHLFFSVTKAIHWLKVGTNLAQVFFFGVFFIIAFFFIMTDTEKQDRAEIEAYLVSTFSRVVDEYGQQLDITLALPTLVELIKNGGQDDPDKVKSWTF